jgi:alpha-glucosidase
LPSQPNLNVHIREVQEALLATAASGSTAASTASASMPSTFSMHDPLLRDNPPVAPGVGKRTRPFDFQHHYYNQSHPDIPQFLTRVRKLLDSYGGRFTVAEVGGEQADREMKLFTAGGDRLNSAYGFNFLYSDALTAELIHSTIHLWPGEPGEGWPSWAFSNHDAPRVVSRWQDGRDQDAVARLCMLLLMSLRGNIFLYQGEELGLPQADVPFDRLQDPEAIANWPETQGRDGARTPMPWQADAPHGGFSRGVPWLPLDASHLPLAAGRQEEDPGSILNLTRRLIALRKQSPALRTATIRSVQTSTPLLAFERGEGDDRLLCVFNLTDGEIEWPVPSGWRVIERVGHALEPLSGWIAEPAR